jgi:hypothetical protein
MSFILLNARLFSGGTDLSGFGNKLDLSSECEEKPTTNWMSGGWTEVKGGLFSTEISGAGQWSAGDSSQVDDERFAALGGLGAFTAGPDNSTVGSLAWITYALSGKYSFGGTVGDVAPWESGWKGSWPLVRGKFAHPPGTPRTATGTGTAQQLGAVSATQRLYATLHVLSVSGTDTPTITVTVDSDNAEGFPSATTALSFDAATARGGQVKRVSGAITDDWFRPKWTISGTNPSFLFVVAFGIA